MTTVNDQFQKYVASQTEALEPVRAFNSIAVETFERIARQNYAVLGDYLNFAVDQARVTTKATDVNEYFARQLESTRAFGEQLVRRSQEYLEIASAATSKAQVTAISTAEKAAKKAA